MPWSLVTEWGDFDNWNGISDSRSGGIYALGVDTNRLTTSTGFDYFSDTAGPGAFIMFGLTRRTWGIRLLVGTPIQAQNIELAWEYAPSNNTWLPLTVTNAYAMLSSGVQDVTWDPPDEWHITQHTGYSQPAYYVRCRIVSVTGLTEGGAQGAQRVQFALRMLCATGSETSGSLASAVTADQNNGWGVISNIGSSGTRRYYIRANLRVGDGSTTTTLALQNCLLVFLHGCYLHVDNDATCTLGTISNEGLWNERTSAGCEIQEATSSLSGPGDLQYRAIQRVRGSGSLYVYATKWHIRTQHYQTGYPWFISTGTGELKFVDCFLQADGGDGYFRIARSAGITLKRCTILSVAEQLTLAIYATGNTYEDIRGGRLQVGTSSGITRIRKAQMTSVRVAVVSPGARFELVDCTTLPRTAFSVSWVGWSSRTDVLWIIYTLRLRVEQSPGVPLEGARVVIKNVLGNTVYDNYTNSQGTVEVELVAEAADHIQEVGLSWRTLTPHRVIISHPDFETREVEYTMDRPREEVELLTPPSGRGPIIGSRIVRGIGAM